MVRSNAEKVVQSPLILATALFAEPELEIGGEVYAGILDSQFSSYVATMGFDR